MDAEPTSGLLVDLRIVEQRVDPLAATTLEHAAGLRAPSASSIPATPYVPSPSAAATASASPVRQRDQHEPRVDEVAQPAGDEVEERSSSISEASALPISFSDSNCAQPARRRLVQARVLDRDRRLRGEQLRQLLVLVGEVRRRPAFSVR